MKRLMLAIVVSAFAIGSAAAQGTCESKAVSQFKENIALVLKYYDKLFPLMQEPGRG